MENRDRNSNHRNISSTRSRFDGRPALVTQCFFPFARTGIVRSKHIDSSGPLARSFVRHLTLTPPSLGVQNSTGVVQLLSFLHLRIVAVNTHLKIYVALL